MAAKVRAFSYSETVFLLIITFCFAGVVSASELSAIPPVKQPWKFNGPLGKVDREAALRGLKTFRSTCSSCHGVTLLAFRNLSDLGLSESQIKAISADFSVIDEPDDQGEIKMRTAIPSDRWPAPFDNEKAAAAANNGAIPPDLSLITKARQNGPDYLYSLLTGYNDPPDGFELPEGGHYNPYMDGRSIAMPPPLFDGMVEYENGFKPNKEQVAWDIVNFLQWVSEPEMEARKKLGLKTIIYASVLTVVLYRINKKVWRDVL